jgi:hypothetical protein
VVCLRDEPGGGDVLKKKKEGEKMKGTTQKKSAWMAGLFGAGLVMFLFCGALAWAGDNQWGRGSGCGCEKMTLVATAYATTPNPLGQYAGTVTITLGHDHKKDYQANVIINPEGLPTFSEDGTVHMNLRSQFSCPELASTFECYDHLTLVPVEGDPTRYAIINQFVIFNGAGVFSEAYGKFTASGDAFIAEGRISVVAEGRICDLDMN